MTVAIRQELPPYKLALRLDGPGGVTARWSEDETLPQNVLSGLEFSDECPGGYKDLSGVLARDPQLNWPDLAAFSDIVVSLAGGEPVWEGSLDKAPDDSGEQPSISPTGLGYQAILEDNSAAQIGIIDTDYTRFGDPSGQRRLNVLKAGAYVFSQAVNVGFQDVGTTGPGVYFTLGTTTGASTELGEQVAYYDGVDVGKFMFDFISNTGEDPAYADVARLAQDDLIGGSFDVSADYNAKEALQQTLNASKAGRKYIALLAEYGGVAVGENLTNTHGWVNMKVMGRHGMTPVGTWPNIGFTAKQSLEYVIPNFASPLTVDPNYIDDDGFLIPQAWYGGPGGVSEAVKDLTKYSLYDWFIYHKKRFELRKPGTYNRFWKAYVAESQLNEMGLDSQMLWRSIVVTYTDSGGNTRTVGPPGSGCNVESASLEITDPDHPAVKAGRTRRDVLDLRGIGNPTTAIAVGQRFLEEANLLNRSGSATLPAYVMDNTGVFHPSCVVKSGDWISFIDARDTSYRKIVNKRFRNVEKQIEIDVDAPSSGLEALLERLQAGLLSLGVG